MSGNSRAPPVRGLDGSRKLVGCDEVVSFEIVHAFIEPVIHGAYSVIRTVQLIQLERVRALALKVRAGDVHLGTRHFARVNMFLNFKIGIWLQRTASANRGDASRQI